MKNKIYSVLYVFLFIMTACYDDNGNYDYVKIDPVVVTGLEKEYVRVAFQDVLYIDPEIVSEDEGKEYEYLWTINLSKSAGASLQGIEIKLDTIGTERVLDYPVSTQGFYDLTLRVKDPDNGLCTFYVTSLKVVTKFSEGFYFLKDMGNSTDLDLFLRDNSKMENIFKIMYGEALPAAPMNLGLDPGYCFVNPDDGKYNVTKALMVCTENDVRIMKIEDMSTIFTYETMFHGDVPEVKPYYMWRNLYGVGFLTDNGIYFSYQASTYSIWGSGKFGYPVLIDNEEHTKPMNLGIFIGNYFFYFDELKRRFLYIDHNGGLHTLKDEIKGTMEDGKYSPNGIRHQLKFISRTYFDKKNVGYALFEDADVGGKHYLYRMELSDAPYNPIKKVVELPASSGLNNAKLFATNELTAEIVYFVNDNKLYMYDPGAGTEMELFPEGLDGEGEITYISNRYWIGSKDAANNFDYFVIATHKAGKYKVLLYETVGGQPHGQAKWCFEGEGKIIKMHYVSPLMDGGSCKEFPGSL